MKIQTWLAAGMAAISLSTQGALYSYTWSVGTTIPDADPSGYINNEVISDSMQGNVAFPPNPCIASVVDVKINLSGGWNGDLIAYIRYDSGSGVGFTSLLNRVGTGTGNPIGYTDAGMNVALTDGTGIDIHAYGGTGVLTGTYLLDQSGSSPSFSSFQGLNPITGTWSIFFADMSGNNVSTLNSWGLDLEVVPEPVNVALAIFCGLIGTVILTRSDPGRRLLGFYGGN